MRNLKGSPKTTKNGIVGAIVTMLITLSVTFIAPKNPELAEIIKGSEGAILAIGTSIASIVALIGARAKDKDQ